MREFREVRKDLSGDEEAAAPYIGVARTLLGQLKNRMALGGLSQLTRSTRLPDGTLITVASSFGRDTIRINAAAGVSQASVEEELTVPTVELPSGELDFNTPGSITIAGAGLARVDGIPNFNWSGVGVEWIPPPHLVTPTFVGIDNGTGCVVPWAISSSGAIMAGSAVLQSGDAVGFRWSKAHGTEVIRYGSNDTTNLMGISGNGHALVGVTLSQADFHVPILAIESIDAGSPVALPLPSGMQSSYAAAISADGSTVVGAVDPAVYMGTGYATVWGAQRNPIQLSSNPSSALGVSHNGRIVLGGEYISGSAHACMWVDGVKQSLGVSGYAYACSQSGDVIVGADTIYTGQFGGPLNGTIGQWIAHVDFIYPPTGWIWHNGQITSLGLGAPLGISPDGSMIVGWQSQDGFAPGGGRYSNAVVWDGHGNSKALPLPPAYNERSVASCIAVVDPTAFSVSY